MQDKYICSDPADISIRVSLSTKTKLFSVFFFSLFFSCVLFSIPRFFSSYWQRHPHPNPPPDSPQMQALTRLLRPASASLPGRPGPQCGPKALPSYFCLFVCLFVFMPPATSPSQGSSVRPEAVGIVGFSFSPTGLEVNCRVVLLSGQSDPTVMLLLLSIYRLWVPGATILFWHGGYHCLGREKNLRVSPGSPSISPRGHPPWWPFCPLPLLKLSSSMRQPSLLESLQQGYNSLLVLLLLPVSSPGGGGEGEMVYTPGTRGKVHSLLQSPLQGRQASQTCLFHIVCPPPFLSKYRNYFLLRKEARVSSSPISDSIKD